MSSRLIDLLPCESKIRILSSQIGTGFFYKDSSISATDRWYFVVGYKDDTFYLVLPQSNIERRLFARGEERHNLKTLIIINTGDYPELNRESIIDCNTIHNVSHSWLVNTCKKHRFEIRTTCSNALMQKILISVRNSELVSDEVKEIIEKCNTSS